MNRGAFAQFEGKIYDCVNGGASSATLHWTFNYANNTETKPIGVTYEATFIGGSCTSLAQSFTN